MSPETLEALKAAYAAMLRDRSAWRIRNQAFYCHVRDVIADATQLPSQAMQEIMEQFVALEPRAADLTVIPCPRP